MIFGAVENVTNLLIVNRLWWIISMLITKVRMIDTLDGIRPIVAKLFISKIKNKHC